jgi:hypothetical protein
MFRRFLTALGLGARALDPDAFTKLAHGIFEKQAPDHKIEIVAPLQFSITPPDGSSQTVFLDNLYVVCQAQPHKRDAEISRFAKLMVDGPAVEVVLPKSIVPLIRDGAMVGEMEEHLSSKEPGAAKPKLACEPLGADLVIIYVADNPQTIQYLTTDVIAEMNLAGRTLRELAVENLNEILADVKSEGANGIFFFSAGGCYEPSLLLMDRIWNKFAELVKGEIVFGIPTRDALFVADSAVPEAVAHLRKIVPEIHGKAPYRISNKLYVRRRDGITFFPAAAAG